MQHCRSLPGAQYACRPLLQQQPCTGWVSVYGETMCSASYACAKGLPQVGRLIPALFRVIIECFLQLWMLARPGIWTVCLQKQPVKRDLQRSSPRLGMLLHAQQQ